MLKDRSWIPKARELGHLGEGAEMVSLSVGFSHSTFSERMVICKLLSLTQGHRPEQEAVVSSPRGVMIRLRGLLLKGERWGETGRRLEPSGRN